MTDIQVGGLKTKGLVWDFAALIIKLTGFGVSRWGLKLCFIECCPPKYRQTDRQTDRHKYIHAYVHT